MVRCDLSIFLPDRISAANGPGHPTIFTFPGRDKLHYVAYLLRKGMKHECEYFK
jgi:hypothetical protein